MLICNKP